MPPSAVLFAFDGVLADLENHHAAAWQRTLARLGWVIPDDQAARSALLDDHLFAAEVFTGRGIVQADLDGWVDRKRELMHSLVGHSPRLFPGAAELIAGLAGRARLAVTADFPRGLVEQALDGLGLSGRIERIIAVEDARAGAGAGTKGVRTRPDPIRQALKQMKLTAGRVAAVEATADGLAAARASGVVRIAVGHRRAFGEWVGDARYVSGFEPVSAVLAQLGFAEAP